jgi:cytochrome P450
MTQKTMYSKYTGFAVDHVEILKAVKVDLTRHINANLDSLREELRYGLDKELGPCEDWTPVQLYPQLARIVALMSGRIFVGLPLSREEEWIDASVNYTRDVMVARAAIIRQPEILHPFIARLLPEVRSLRRYGERGAVLLTPLIKEILALESAGKLHEVDLEENMRGTMVSWMLKYSTSRSVRQIADDQMALSFAAIFTTTGTTSQAIFDLVCRPEYLKPLRDEIQQVVDEDGYDDISGMPRKLKKQSIPKLRKLDSFIKESMRLSPQTIVTMDRITTAPLHLSTGHTIPKGVHISFPSYAISLTAPSIAPAQSCNPESYVPLHEFDGFRFAKLRAMEGNENKVCADIYWRNL